MNWPGISHQVLLRNVEDAWKRLSLWCDLFIKSCGVLTKYGARSRMQTVPPCSCKKIKDRRFFFNLG